MFVAVPPLEQVGLGDVLLDSVMWGMGDERRQFAGLWAMITDWKPDVIFVPNTSWQPFRIIPAVTMTQNMEIVAMPVGGNSVVDVAKNLLRRWRAKQSCQQSDRVIAKQPKKAACRSIRSPGKPLAILPWIRWIPLIWQAARRSCVPLLGHIKNIDKIRSERLLRSDSALLGSSDIVARILCELVDENK